MSDAGLQVPDLEDDLLVVADDDLCDLDPGLC